MIIIHPFSPTNASSVVADIVGRSIVVGRTIVVGSIVVASSSVVVGFIVASSIVRLYVIVVVHAATYHNFTTLLLLTNVIHCHFFSVRILTLSLSVSSQVFVIVFVL